MAVASKTPQQPQFSVEQGARLFCIDLPAPRVGNVECAADLAGTPMRHREESSRITTIATIALGNVEHDATRGALDLIGSLGAVLPKLRDDRAQCANQIQGNGVRNEHRLVSLLV